MNSCPGFALTPSLHPALQMRVLLSVSSVSTLLATWSHIEASSIDLSILQAGRRRKAGGIGFLLKVNLPSILP